MHTTVKLFIGNDISNIVIVPSEIPLISLLTGNLSLFISGFAPMGTRIRETLQVQISKYVLVHGQDVCI